MGLSVRFVESLDEIVEPVISYLTDGGHDTDLFKPQYLIVPTAGVRAWLAPKVAASIGASAGVNDGVLANVRIGYMGMLNQILRGGIDDESDSWSIERMTMAILSVIRDRDPEKDPFIQKYGGHLRAARAMADRFDRYAARRPQLIREWEAAFVSRAEVGRENAQEEWQFLLWSQLRGIIDVPSWPARTKDLCSRLRAGESLPDLPSRLMVAGAETMSISNLEILEALSHVIDVQVLVVHPSPQLAEHWSHMAASVQPTPGLAPRRTDEEHVVAECDMLVTTWLRGSYEMQMLLASQGITAKAHQMGEETPRLGALLGRMQEAIKSPGNVAVADVPRTDVSLQIHRAHNLSRQVEILRDALMHAFHDLRSPALRPDDVVVLCADIEAAAPLLRAAFDHPVQVASGEKVQIPLVVADRSLRAISDGAKLLVDLLGLVTSRFDVKSVLGVAASDLVLRHLRLDLDDVEVWIRHVETTRVRWGIDPEHRKAHGFDASDITAHTWKQVLDRALLGSLLPDAPTPVRELGGVVPLVQVETSDIEALSGLSEVLAVLAEIERRAREPESVSVWCDLVEDSILALCGESCTEIDDVLTVIQSFRDSCNIEDSEGSGLIVSPVEFEEFADLLVRKVSGAPGHQPLRTGAVTATSFVPLRSVPFRVVCVIGLDDGTLSMGEAEGDDLVANDPLMGDPDPRVDTRRVLLDAVMAANDRLIITCNGRSIKNNSHVPLVTPLAELLDFCERLGVEVPDDPNDASSVEHVHPRHASGRGNFLVTGGPVEGRVWSHDVAALNAAQAMFSAPAMPGHVVATGQPLPKVPLKNLEDIVINPLTYYMRETLRVFTEYEDDEPGAVLPVTATNFEIANLAEALVTVVRERNLGNEVDASVNGQIIKDWTAVSESTDMLPAGAFGTRALELAQKVATAVWGRAIAEGVPVADPDPLEFEVQGSDGTTVNCTVPRVQNGIVYSVLYHMSVEKELTRLSLRLLALRAGGHEVSRAVLVHRDSTKTAQMADIIVLAPEVTPDIARERLIALARSEPMVRVTPCPEFGEAGVAIATSGELDNDAVVKAVEEFADKRDYFQKPEAVVFGPNPDPSRVYPAGSDALVEFFEALGSIGERTKDGDKEKDTHTQRWVIS